jgi:hypothetical protein
MKLLIIIIYFIHHNSKFFFFKRYFLTSTRKGNWDKKRVSSCGCIKVSIRGGWWYIGARVVTASNIPVAQAI